MIHLTENRFSHSVIHTISNENDMWLLPLASMAIIEPGLKNGLLLAVLMVATVILLPPVVFLIKRCIHRSIIALTAPVILFGFIFTSHQLTAAYLPFSLDQGMNMAVTLVFLYTGSQLFTSNKNVHFMPAFTIPQTSVLAVLIICISLVCELLSSSTPGNWQLLHFSIFPILKKPAGILFLLGGATAICNLVLRKKGQNGDAPV